MNSNKINNQIMHSYNKGEHLKEHFRWGRISLLMIEVLSSTDSEMPLMVFLLKKHL